MVVKLAASMAGALRAARHNSELPAKAIMARTVNTAIRAIDIS
jgi:stage V sporulation protein SpoVS